MTDRRRLLAAAGAAGAVVVIAIGVTGYGAIIPRLPGTPDPVPAGSYAAPTIILAPRLKPPGVWLEAVAHASVPTPDRLTLYGEAGSADPLAGRSITVAYLDSSEAAALPGWRAPGARSVWINGRRAQVARIGQDIWVTWEVPHESDQESSQYGAGGRGVSEEEVVRVARHLVVGDDHRPLIEAGGLPAGLIPLATGAASIVERNGSPFGVGTTLRWTDARAGHYVYLTLARANPAGVRLARALARSPGAGVRIEGDTVALVVSRGLSGVELDEVISGLRPADSTALAALRRSVAQYPPDRLLPPEARLIASGHFDGGVWAVGAEGTSTGKPSHIVEIRAADGGRDAGSGYYPPLDGPLQVEAHNWEAAVFLLGRVSPVVASVRVTLADGRRAQARLGSPDPDGARWFGLYFAAPASPATVVAYDPRGALVATETR